MIKRPHSKLPAIILICSCLILDVATAATKLPPNILFIIMDDVGIDQMQSFGYGGATPPAMPNIDQIAKSGIRFRNHSSMPACTPSRAVVFEGRFPIRTNIKGALGPDDLANSMVSPFEMTVPKLLKKRNYKSGLFGKFHLGLQDNSPYGLGMPRALGWDYYYGWLDKTGDPSSIDTSAGGVAPKGTYSCGYVPGSANGGADQGACYKVDDSCSEISGTGSNPPGRACRDSGGIFNPNQTCASPIPSNIKDGFLNLSGHYVNPLVINHDDGRIEQVPPTDKRARIYRGIDPVNAAIDWIKTIKNRPWMATISFATVHTPLQQPPVELLPVGSVDTNSLDCSSTDPQNAQPLNNQMITAMDTEIGRLLVAVGLAKYRQDGSLDYTPKQSNTMVVVMGDNGSMGYTVKLPFDAKRSKGTAYQTGVWVPLVVSGPLVNKPDREVPHMTNIADVYQLFGEIAKIDVHKSVPRPLDSVSMLPYLKNPNQKSIRKWNFTEGDLNIQANGSLNGPCVLGGGASCSHIPVSKSVCEDNGGVWWGAGATDPSTAGIPAEGLSHCCDVNVWKAGHGQALSDIIPQGTQAIRNDHYKIVNNFTKDYDLVSNACYDNPAEEFYRIDENVPLPKLDREDENLLKEGAPALTKLENMNYQVLLKKLGALEKSVVSCPGDGNQDGRVNQMDIDEWETFSATTGITTPNGGGKSSWYDFDYDGDTDLDDKAVIEGNMGKRCSTAKQASNTLRR